MTKWVRIAYVAPKASGRKFEDVPASRLRLAVRSPRRHSLIPSPDAWSGTELPEPKTIFFIKNMLPQPGWYKCTIVQMKATKGELTVSGGRDRAPKIADTGSPAFMPLQAVGASVERKAAKHDKIRRAQNSAVSKLKVSDEVLQEPSTSSPPSGTCQSKSVGHKKHPKMMEGNLSDACDDGDDAGTNRRKIARREEEGGILSEKRLSGGTPPVGQSRLSGGSSSKSQRLIGETLSEGATPERGTGSRIDETPRRGSLDRIGNLSEESRNFLSSVVLQDVAPRAGSSVGKGRKEGRPISSQSPATPLPKLSPLKDNSSNLVHMNERMSAIENTLGGIGATLASLVTVVGDLQCKKKTSPGTEEEPLEEGAEAMSIKDEYLHNARVATTVGTRVKELAIGLLGKENLHRFCCGRAGENRTPVAAAVLKCIYKHLRSLHQDYPVPTKTGKTPPPLEALTMDFVRTKLRGVFNEAQPYRTERPHRPRSKSQKGKEDSSTSGNSTSSSSADEECDSGQMVTAEPTAIVLDENGIECSDTLGVAANQWEVEGTYEVVAVEESEVADRGAGLEASSMEVDGNAEDAGELPLEDAEDSEHSDDASIGDIEGVPVLSFGDDGDVIGDYDVDGGCVNCTDGPITTTLTPCGHRLLCWPCAQGTKRCPECDRTVKGTKWNAQ